MTVGWAIVSTGRHPDQKIAPAIAAARNARLAAVVSRDLGRAQEFAAKHGAPNAYDDLGAALADPTVDVVYIASPNALHASQTIAAAGAGKHVLVEKPMALTVDDCQRMIKACDEAGVKLGVGFHLRNHPGHQRLRELVQGGALGKIALAEANWGRGVRGQEKPPPRPPQQAWWDDPSQVGAGAMMATGVHCVDTLRYVLGDDITEVVAMNDASSEAPLEELLAMSLRFRGGAIATVMTGRRTPDYARNDVVVYGSLGRGGVHGSVDVNLGGRLSIAAEGASEEEGFESDPIALYTWEVEAFSRAVEDGGEPPASGVDGLEAAKVTIAMVESAKTGQRVIIS